MSVSPSTLLATPHAVSPSRRLSGWLSAGMLDWPGRVAATLFLSGCQMRCPYCHNPSLITPRDDDADIVWSEVLTYLDKRRSWIDGFVITGGEPTEDPDIVTLLERFKAADVPVKLDTNGLRPDVLGAILKRKLVAYVALDVKTLPNAYQRLTAVPGASDLIRESVDAVRGSGVEHEFRTTCYPGTVDLDSLEEIASWLEGGRLYALQQYRTATTLSADARRIEPLEPTALLEAATRCSAHIPTVTRGV